MRNAWTSQNARCSATIRLGRDGRLSLTVIPRAAIRAGEELQTSTPPSPCEPAMLLDVPAMVNELAHQRALSTNWYA
jgi:hypothetical protein